MLTNYSRINSFLGIDNSFAIRFEFYIRLKLWGQYFSRAANAKLKSILVL